MDKNVIYRDEKFIEAYIQTEEKFEWYKEAFSEFVPGSFSWKWSWYGCFFSTTMLVYRKCYIEVILSWILSLIVASFTFGIGGILFSILMGGVTPYLIYRRYLSKVSLAVSETDDYEEQLEILRKTGGVNRIGRNILIFLNILNYLFMFVYFLVVFFGNL